MSALLPHRNLMGYDEIVTTTPWRHEGQDLGEWVAWQPGLDLDFNSEIDIDLDAAAETLGFDPVGSTEMVIEWFSDSTRLREHCARFDAAARVELFAQLPGSRIGGTLTLIRRLVTKHAIDTTDPFAPDAPGAILWEDKTSVRVEGSGTQFSLFTSSFVGAGLGPNAIWAIQLPTREDVEDPDILDEPASEHVSVRLNSDNPLAARIAEGAEDDETANVLQSIITSELALGLAELAVALPDPDAEYDTGTLGRLLTTVMWRLGTQSTAQLAQLGHERLSALVQHHFLAEDR